MTRKIFPNACLQLNTNGILLTSMTNEFWMTCYSCKINILITEYDVNLDRKNVLKKAYEYYVSVQFYGAHPNKYRTMYKLALDLNGGQNKEEMYKLCWRKDCTYFEDGKLYKCTIAGNIRHFNDYFNKKLEVTENDYIDLYKIKSSDAITEYFNKKSIDFCKYCDMNAQQKGLKFEISKKDIKDWCK